MDMSVEEIFGGLAALVSDPQVMWNLAEEYFRPNFFEPVIIKRYASLFENKDESEFAK